MKGMTVPIFAFFQLIPALIATALCLYLWRHRGGMQDRRGYFLPMVIQAGLAVSSLAYGAELVTAELDRKLACIFFRYLGSYMMLLGTLFFALWYKGQRQWLTWRRAVVISLPAGLSLAAIATNGLHHLYYPAIWLLQGLGVPQLAHSTGPFHDWTIVYSLALIVATAYIFLGCQLTIPRIYGPGMALVTGGYFTMVMGYVFYLSGFRPFGFMNVTYYFSTVNAITLTLAVVRYGVHRVRPLGYEVVIRDLPIGVILFDRDMRVVEINPMARRILSLDAGESLLGKPLPEIPLQDQNLLDFCAVREAGSMETHINGRDLLCNLTEIRDHLNEVTGISLLLQDITERKRAEEALRKSEERYRELSIVDALTQLYNSRHFYNQLKMEINRATRYQEPLTLILLDLDNFKAFNDVYGHVEGDQILSQFGRVVKRCLRQTDSAYRYGGDEFTLLLPMTTGEHGLVIAERIRTELKKEIFSPDPGKNIQITASIGIAQYKIDEDIKSFIQRVDRLMYKAKKDAKEGGCRETPDSRTPSGRGCPRW